MASAADAASTSRKPSINGSPAGCANSHTATASMETVAANVILFMPNSSYFYNPTLCRYHHRLCPVIHVQPSQDDVDVPFHCPSRDTQRVGDFLIVEPLHDQTQNVQFTRT